MRRRPRRTARAGARTRPRREEAEAELIDGYLPEQISDDELQQLVADALAETGAESQKEMGKVMSAVMAKARGAPTAGGSASWSRSDWPADGRPDDRLREQLTLDPAVATELAGSEDTVLKALEGHLDCDVFLRGNVLTLDGSRRATSRSAVRSSRSCPS